jgi:hypothetical protein
VGAHMATDGMRFGILNVLSLRPPLTGLPAAEPMDYGAETVEIRRLRREARWTPVAAESVLVVVSITVFSVIAVRAFVDRPNSRTIRSDVATLLAP